MLSNNRRKYLSFLSLFGFLIIVIPIALYAEDSSTAGSLLEHAISTSNLFWTANACCFAASLPMVIDIFLDSLISSQWKSSKSDLWERFVYLSVLIVPSILAFSIGSHEIMVKAYVAAVYVRLMVLNLLVYSSVVEEMIKSNRGRMLSDITILLLTCRISFTASATFYNFSASITQILAYSAFFFGIIISCVSIAWMYKILQKLRHSHKHYTDDEYRCIVLVVTYNLFLWGIAAVRTATDSWRLGSSKETGLVALSFLQILFTVIVTVLPGRIARFRYYASTQMLSMKQVFVRYVSHEIRSPLNVVIAGLDLVLASMKKCSVLPTELSSAIVMLEDIFDASNTAIFILNDLLDYESMDAGSFQLEIEQHPVEHFFDGKLNWAAILAQKQQISFSISDGSSTSCDQNSQLDGQSETILEEPPPPLTDTLTRSRRNNLPPLEDLYLRVDNMKIHQALRNLLTNSLKFTPKNGKVGVSIRVLRIEESSISVQDAVGALRIEVDDSGAGINEIDQARLFSEFCQFDRNKLQGGGGSGLGLWISKTIVAMHDGHIGCHSKGKGHGSTFFFELPLFICKLAHSTNTSAQNAPLTLPTARIHPFNDDKSDHQSISIVDPATSSMPNYHPLFDIESQQNIVDHSCATEKKSLTFLVVDDSDLNRKIVRRILESDDTICEGVTIIEANDGNVAVDMVREWQREQKHIDFILMDNIMIDLNGPEAAQIIKNELKYSGVIIGITGNALPADINHFLVHGVAEVIVKPIKKKGLLDCLGRYIP